jgi:hypothetical protein
MLPELRLVAENNTDTYLTDVRMELTFDDDRIVRLDSKPDVFEAAARPLPFGDERLIMGAHHDLSVPISKRAGLITAREGHVGRWP